MNESLTSFLMRRVCEHPLDEGCHPNAFIHSADQLDQLFERLALHRGAFDEIVEVCDVCLMVPAVMEIHRALGDVRLERVLRVG